MTSSQKTFAHGASAVVIASFAFGIFLAITVKPEQAASQSSPVTIFLTSGTSWTVPSDWNDSNNTIEVIGGGGGGGTGTGGGGGGAYSKVMNVTLTPGNSVSIRVGAGGAQNAAGGDTYFCNNTSNCASISGTAVIAGAKSGGGASNVLTTPGSGGAAASGIGSVKYSGGNGGAGGAGGCGSGGSGGGGGGGGAGPNGSGRNGGVIPSCGLGGGGGGGAGGTSSTAGAGPSGSSGGAGGQGRSGSGGGTAGTPNGGNGSNGGGGGGGQGTASFNTGNGGNGGTGTDWDATHGAGGGGAGSGGSSNIDAVTGNAGDGALYGGGGGGVGYAGSNGTFGFGPGAQGLIVITYTPFSATAPTAPQSLSATGDVEQISLSWSAPADDGGSPITTYKIYRDTNPTPTTLYDTIGNLTSYVDTSVIVDTPYYYRVKAVNGIGDSPYSNEDNTTATSSCPPGGNGGTISGWGWSENIGWVSLNSGDEGTCAGSTAYGLSLSGSSITGYAWSENLGWIQFGGLSGFPTGSGTVSSNATVQGSSVVGWARALSHSDAQSGGWDGWLSLSGDNHTVTYDSIENALLGWAWGDTNVGWVDFGAGYACSATYGYYCDGNVRHYRDLSCGTDTIVGVPETCSYACQSGACVPPPDPIGTLGGGIAIKVTPTLIRPNATVTVEWGTQDTTSCTVTENNVSINDTWPGTSGSQTSSPLNTTTTYTINCDSGALVQSATVRTTARWREI